MNNTNLYEILQYPDPTLPMIYHEDKVMTSPFSMHWHDSVEILYFTQGSGHTKCDHQAIESKAGDVIIINTNQLHTVIPHGETVRYHCFILSQGLFDKRDINIHKANFKNRVAKDSYINRLFDLVIKEWNLKEEGYKLKIKGYLYAIFGHLMRNYVEPAPTSDKQTIKMIQMIKSALLYMEHHYPEDITLDGICDHVNLSKYYFSRIFKETVGKSPVEYLNTIRVNHATEMLLEGAYNVSEVAEACGFNSINYFCKVYKRLTGVSASTIKNR